MKIRVNRASFLSACQNAGMAVSPRDVKPVLRNLKVVAKDDEATLMATDLEIGLRFVVRGLGIEHPGEVLLPADRTGRILREMPDDEVLIEAEGDTLLIVGNSAEFDLPYENPEEYPDVIHNLRDDLTIEIKAGKLRDLFVRTSFAAASVENNRFGATTGVKIEAEGRKVVCVATDGRRLAMAEAEAEHGAGLNPQPIVPRKAVNILLRLLDDPEEIVSIQATQSQILFHTPRALVMARQVEGRFPNYKPVLPKDFSTEARTTASPFLAAIRQAAIMTDDESKRVVFAFTPSSMTLQAKGTTAGRSKIQSRVDLDGSPVEISFDPHYLVDFLKVLPGEQAITLKLKDGQSAGLFDAGEGYRYVVVPLVETAG